MNHRHLLPEEIDLLLDDEVGFGVVALREHVRDCAQCRSRLDEARRVVAVLERVPQFAPSFGMADRVMAEVPVFVPWQQAALDAVRRFAPRSRSARIGAVGLAGAAAAGLSAAIVWLAAHGGLVAFTAEVAATHLRSAAGQVLNSGLVSLFGPSAASSLQPGGLAGLAAIAGGFVAAAVVCGLGLRAIAVSHRRS